MTEPAPNRPFGDPEADYTPPLLEPRALAVLRALAGGRIAALHMRRGLRGAVRRGENPFLNKVIRLLRADGFRVALLPYYRPPYLRWLNRRCLHLYRGPGTPRREPGVLHAAKGYVDGYWYLDRKGQRAWSSVGDQSYDAAEIDAAPANALYRELRRRHVRTGHSARAQAPRGAALPQGAIALFLQGLDGDAVAPACSEAEMIRAVAAARGTRPVLIKEHPFGTPPAVRRALAGVRGGDVQVIDANVHDILDQAALVACMSSGVGFEALLHRKPVMTFAHVDYHHAVHRVATLDDLAAQIDAALARKLNHPKYVWWFLETQLFHLNQPDVEDRLRAVLRGA